MSGWGRFSIFGGEREWEAREESGEGSKDSSLWWRCVIQRDKNASGSLP